MMSNVTKWSKFSKIRSHLLNLLLAVINSYVYIAIYHVEQLYIAIAIPAELQGSGKTFLWHTTEGVTVNSNRNNADDNRIKRTKGLVIFSVLDTVGDGFVGGRSFEREI